MVFVNVYFGDTTAHAEYSLAFNNGFRYFCSMEKRRAHYSLLHVKALILVRGADAFTLTALTNARLMGLSAAQAVGVISSLTPAMFYKSMTAHFDSSVWQDVYHAPTPVGRCAYIKLMLQDVAVVIQFKEK
jgi:motility quorum-sensing regulator/GCU-specific mRNA interferase toxin